MKLYVSGNYSEDRERCRYIMSKLTEAGHEITCDWTDPKYENAPYDLCCQADVEGIKNADLIVFYAIFDRKYQGSFVEMGMALALQKPVYIMGDAVNACIFVAHPLVRQFQVLSEIINVLVPAKVRPWRTKADEVVK